MLRDAGLGADIASAREAAKQEMAEAYRIARETPHPEPALAFADVQDVGDPRVEAF